MTSSIRMACRKTWPEDVAGRRGRKAWPESVVGRRGRKAWLEKRACRNRRTFSNGSALMVKYFGQMGVVDRVRELWKQMTPRGLQPGPLAFSCERVGSCGQRQRSFAGVMQAFLGVLYAGMGAGQALADLGNVTKAKVACRDMFALMDRKSLVNGLEPVGDMLMSSTDAGRITFGCVRFL